MAYYSYCREKTLTIKTHLNVINKTYRTTIRDDSFFLHRFISYSFFQKITQRLFHLQGRTFMRKGKNNEGLIV